MLGPYGKLMIFNIYNLCTNLMTKVAFWQFLRENAGDIWRGNNSHMLWCRDFNQHHPLWDRDEDTHLFTLDALWKAEPLIELLADYDMEMILQKGVPTLQHMHSKRYSRPDNIFCSRSMTNSVLKCSVDAETCPTKTDHFPIATLLELPQERIVSKPTCDFRMAD